MQIKRTATKTKKNIIVISLLLILVVVAGVLFVFKDSFTSKSNDSVTENSSTNLSPPSEEQKKAGDEAEKSHATNNDSSPSPPAPPSSPTKQPVNVTITNMSQDSDSTLKIRTLIATTESGRCTITITQDNLTKFTDSANSQAQANYSTCMGFDVAQSQHSIAGKAVVSISFISERYTGSATSEITLQ